MIAEPTMFELRATRIRQSTRSRAAPRLAVVTSVLMAVAVSATAASPASAQDTPGSKKAPTDQKPVRVTRLVGASVVNAQHQAIGVIDDLLVSQDGIQTAIVGLSGSLGIGEKDISVPFTELSFENPVSGTASGGQSPGSLRLLLPMTTQQIVDAPPFTSGSGGAAIGTFSTTGGTPEGVQKQPKSSTQSGGPG